MTVTEHIQHIKDNLCTRGEWTLEDYRDFYERDVVSFLLPLVSGPLLSIVQGVNIEDVPDEFSDWVWGKCSTNGGNCFNVEQQSTFGKWLEDQGFVFRHGVGTTYVWDWLVVWR